MLAQPVDRERPGIPSLVRVLFDEPGALESSQHLMGDGPADAEMLRERALVDKEPTVRQQGRDGVLDERIDARLVIGRLETARYGLGQAQARVLELPAHDHPRIGVNRQIAPPVELLDQSFVAQPLQRGGGRDAAGFEGAGDARFAQHQPGRKAAIDQMLAQHAVDYLVERPRSAVRARQASARRRRRARPRG